MYYYLGEKYINHLGTPFFTEKGRKRIDFYRKIPN